MVENYLKLAFRNFKKRKGHTFINITGLAIALVCCIFIGLYVQYQLSYDTFEKKGDRIYRVMQTSITPEETNTDKVLQANSESDPGAPYEFNPFTGEIFDERGYPSEWDTIPFDEVTAITKQQLN